MAETARDRQRKQTRRRLFDAALEVIRRDGLHDARIDDIAKRAGVSRPTFYFHFPTKRDVLAELRDQSEDELAAVLAGIPDTTPLDEVFRIASETVRERWQDDPVLFVESSLISLREATKELGGHRTRVRQEMARHFRNAAARGEVGDIMPPELLADLYLANMLTASLVWAGTPEMALDGMIQAAAQVFRYGALGPR